MKKIKYDRRRAIECTIVEKSKSNPGYLKYQVTIQEKDGTVHKQPCYGKDMQDALSRLINRERTVKVEKKMERNPFMFFFVWCVIMAVPAILSDIESTPWFILYIFVGFTFIFLLAGWWEHYLDKGKR